MKKIFFILILSLVGNISFAQEMLEGSVAIEWVTKTQLERDQNIAAVRQVLYGTDFVKKYKKKDFKALYKDYLKDDKYKLHYLEAAAGHKTTQNANLAGFYFKKTNMLISYAMQYFNNKRNIFYYDTLGNLKYIDILSENYPSYPYYSRQYTSTGNLVGQIYFVSRDTQYVYKPNGEFKGLWHKDNFYSDKAKFIMQRNNY